MTYCLAIKVNDGIVFASDTRTNAGVDQVSTYSKMYAFGIPGERSFVMLSAGNLATTQAVVNLVERDLAAADPERSLKTVDYMFDAAHYIGKLSCGVQAAHCEPAKEEGIKFDASFILGGQIGDSAPEIYLVYPEGNYIAASPTKPYLQIGETKYGKPILDRIIAGETSLEDAARCALVSLDSTMRSNLSVGPPVEIAIYRNNSLALDTPLTFDTDSPFYQAVQRSWNEGLNRVFDDLPRFDWESALRPVSRSGE